MTIPKISSRHDHSWGITVLFFFHIADSPCEPGSQCSRDGLPASSSYTDRNPQPSGVPLPPGLGKYQGQYQPPEKVKLKYMSSWHQCGCFRVETCVVSNTDAFPPFLVLPQPPHPPKPAEKKHIPSRMRDLPLGWERTESPESWWGFLAKLSFICQGLGLESGLLRPAQGLLWRCCHTTSRSEAGTRALLGISVGLNWNSKQRILSNLRLLALKSHVYWVHWTYTTISSSCSSGKWVLFVPFNTVTWNIGPATCK